MPLGNRPEILLISSYRNCFRFELHDKTFIDYVFVCTRRRSRCERGRARRRAILRASERGPVPRPRARKNNTSTSTSRKALKTASSIPSFDACFCPSFYKHNLLPCFINLHMLCMLKTWLDSHPLICYNHSLTT